MIPEGDAVAKDESTENDANIGEDTTEEEKFE